MYVINVRQIAKFVVGLGEKVSRCYGVLLIRMVLVERKAARRGGVIRQVLPWPLIFGWYGGEPIALGRDFSRLGVWCAVRVGQRLFLITPTLPSFDVIVPEGKRIAEPVPLRTPRVDAASDDGRTACPKCFRGVKILCSYAASGWCSFSA